MTGYESLAARWDAAVMGTYGTPSLALVRGQGCRVWDADGKDYLDLLAGIAVNVLGHAHPAVVEAVSRQVATLGHVSNLYINPVAVELAERLLSLLSWSDGRVFFCNSGTEANEAALKLARRHGRDAGGPDKIEVVAALRGFHGRTFGSLSVTGQAAKREPFEPYGGPVTFVPYGDADALGDAVTAESTAAILLEPLLGEAGVVPPPPGYLVAAREVADRAGALLVVDEVQTGLGRTGQWFAHQAERVVPDVVTLAKGLGGGLPIGACIGRGPAAHALRKGDHGSTFGGNPVTCAAALAVLDTIEHDGLLASVTEVGERLATAAVKTGHPLLEGVRGVGLLRALTLHEAVAPAVEAAARDAGFLVNAVAPDAVRLAPPLVLSAAEADEFTSALPEVLDTAAATARVGP